MNICIDRQAYDMLHGKYIDTTFEHDFVFEIINLIKNNIRETKSQLLIAKRITKDIRRHNN